jgi:hypothetical protein
MKKYYCTSEVGSVLIGNEQVRFAIPNGYGDGLTAVRVYDIGEAIDINGNDLHFKTFVEGTFNIYDYDCCDGSQEHVLATLDGRYGVYIGELLVVFQKWRVVR